MPRRTTTSWSASTSTDAESGRVADRPQFRKMLDEASADEFYSERLAQEVARGMCEASSCGVRQADDRLRRAHHSVRRFRLPAPCRGLHQCNAVFRAHRRPCPLKGGAPALPYRAFRQGRPPRHTRSPSPTPATGGDGRAQAEHFIGAVPFLGLRPALQPRTLPPVDHLYEVGRDEIGEAARAHVARPPGWSGAARRAYRVPARPRRRTSATVRAVRRAPSATRVAGCETVEITRERLCASPSREWMRWIRCPASSPSRPTGGPGRVRAPGTNCGAGCLPPTNPIHPARRERPRVTNGNRGRAASQRPGLPRPPASATPVPLPRPGRLE